MAQRALIIVSCTPTYHGTGAKGAYTIYDVVATDQAGAPIQQKLSSFDNLAPGPGTFDVDKYVKDGVIKNYTVKPLAGNRRSSGQVSREEFDMLADNFERFRSYVMGEIATRVPGLAQTQAAPVAAPPAAPVTTPAPAGVDSWAPPPATAPAAAPIDDDDIPF